ncbi:MAG: hypothetical protein H0V82_06505 [Candidatus Protochlamydia sp.]|nr:hypothetical protein [Candidatus Protochlamydia sp.]
MLLFRFLLNFFLFGLLFFLIYTFLPDTFSTLAEWAGKAYDFLREIYLQIAGKISSSNNHVPAKEMLGMGRFWL